MTINNKLIPKFLHVFICPEDLVEYEWSFSDAIVIFEVVMEIFFVCSLVWIDVILSVIVAMVILVVVIVGIVVGGVSIGQI